jgi:hypothetical protein
MRRAIAGLVLAVSLGVTASPAAAAGRASVTPAKHRVDAQVVTIAWHGFKTNVYKETLIVIQCLPSYTTIGLGAACDRVFTHTWYQVTNPTKSGSVTMPVHSGALNRNGSCAISPDTNNCVIVVAALDRHDQVIEGNLVALPISFNLRLTTPSIAADPTTDLTDSSPVHLVGSQFSASQAIAFYECVGNYTTQAFNACSLGVASKGNFDIEFTVHQGSIKTFGEGTMTCGTSVDDNNCVIAAVPDASNDGLVWGSATFIPIAFSLPGG